MEKKSEFNPTDMHSDGVHFDKDILEAKRKESARNGETVQGVTKSIKKDKE